MGLKAKRIQRPRLEAAMGHKVTARIAGRDELLYDIRIESYDEFGGLDINLKDAKRLHRFLGRAIAYLEGRKK